MKITTSKKTDTKVTLTILLGKQELHDAEQVALTKLSQKIKAPGFRAGKVPPSVAMKYVDRQALAEQTLDDALSKGVSVAFTEKKIPALDRPSVDIKRYVPGQELEFSAEVEVLPTVVLGKYTKLGVKKVVDKITNKDISDVIERMRKGFAQRNLVTRAAKDGDEVTIDFVGKKDGRPFDGGSAKNYVLNIGSNQFIPGFEPAIIDHSAGQTFDVPLQFPKDYHVESLAGANVVFSVTLHSVQELELPELNDKLAKKAGPFKTFAELEKDVKKELQASREREATEKFKDELVAKLVAVSKVPVPDILIQDQARSIEQDISQNLMYQGLSLDTFLANKKLTKQEWLESEVRESAIRRVQAGLVLAELSKAEGITATDEELAEKINQYQEQYGNRSGQDFTSPELQRDIANRLLTEKTVDRLVKLNSAN